MNPAALMMMTGRQRRDERGRYMNGDDYDRPGMTYGGSEGGYEMRRYDGDEMRYRGDDGRYHAGQRRGNYDRGTGTEMRYGGTEPSRMGGEGYFAWDHMPIYPPIYLVNNGGPEMRGGGYEGGEPMRQYGRRYNPERSVTMADTHREMSQPMIGFAGADDGSGHEHKLTKEKAQMWVDSMVAADGKVGGRWTLEDIRKHAADFDLNSEQEIIEFFAVINAMYSDYCAVTKQFGVNNADFYAGLAKAWMHDKDAIPNKTAMYMDCIAQHE